MFPGIYRGEVSDRKDPEKRFRVRVKCPQVYGDIPEAQLPWAYPAGLGASVSYNSFDGSGAIVVPRRGSPVWVMFEGGDPRYPVWMSGWFGKSKVKAPKNAYGPDGEPTNQAWITPRGTCIQLDDRQGSEKIILRLPEGDCIAITAKGETEMVARKNLKLKGAVKVEIASTGRVEVKAKGISLYGSERVDILGGNVGVTALGTLALKGSAIQFNGQMLPPVNTTTGADMTVTPSYDGK